MGQLFYEAGYETIFIETSEELVRLINRQGRYPLRLLDAVTKRELDLTIKKVSALAAGDQAAVASAFADAAVAGTAVGQANLEQIAPLIARGIELRRSRGAGPIDVYLCENSLDAFQVLRDSVHGLLEEPARDWADRNVGFVGTVVARMVPAPGERFRGEEPLFVVADSYHRLPYDGTARRAPQPAIEGMTPVASFRAVMERKLFTYNLVHAALAYLGYLEGLQYVHQPFDHPRVMSTVYGALEEAGRALLRKFPGDLTAEGQEEVRRDISLRFANPMIMDTVERVGRDPLRKLGPEDRLIGAARLCLSQEVFPEHIARVAAAALCYDHPQDPSAARLQTMLRQAGPESTLREITGLDPAGSGPTAELGRAIIASYRELCERRRRKGGGS